MNRTRKPTTRRVRRPAAQRLKEKPEVRIVEMSDGSIRIINVGKAAKFCGVRQQTFSIIVRRHYMAQKRKGYTPAVSATDRVRAAYPELFKENHI